jgi:hypothetical protein
MHPTDERKLLRESGRGILDLLMFSRESAFQERELTQSNHCALPATLLRSPLLGLTYRCVDCP